MNTRGESAGDACCCREDGCLASDWPQRGCPDVNVKRLELRLELLIMDKDRSIGQCRDGSQESRPSGVVGGSGGCVGDGSSSGKAGAYES